ncbi:MAG: prepilin-type N-terminal cleavage/methylation domain-containing protein [Candidatus Daviesbacteria bacterium]|nr:prepilin-type N-terminal cleavage/methylation domain-containing protein [Candidatus Daviesbacteria bacterium]
MQVQQPINMLKIHLSFNIVHLAIKKMSNAKSQMLNFRGFTLIELMVAISIVAILATVGLTLFGNAQKTGRDGKRRGDVDAITTNLESRFNTVKNQNCGGTGTERGLMTGTDALASSYCPPQDNWFAGGKVPVDPLNSGAYTYTNAGAPLPTNVVFPSNTYIICAHLETTGSGNATEATSGTAGAGDYYCKKNQQQ